MTQESLADRSGLSVRTVRALERGEIRRPHADTLAYLADALGLETGSAERSMFESSARARTLSDTAASNTGRPTAPKPGSPVPDLVEPPTPLFGREGLVGEAKATLRRADTRLLSLTGSGGVGKTRVALRVAEDLRPEFSGGVVTVGLDAVVDPALVPAAVAHALHLRDEGFAPPLELLLTHLQDKEVLLLLDNFEQVGEAAPLLMRLLEGSPGLKLLVTSRASLRVRGEQEILVPPLEVPAPSEISTGRIAHSPTVKLFVDRARATDRYFRLSEENASAVGEICRRLDGLPLAIELAAARTKLLPPQALLARLGSSLELLAGGGPDLPQRQRAMRRTIAWSEDLLDEHEREIFRRLAVFSGGATLGAAEAVCSSAFATSPTGRTRMLDGLSALLDASLVRRLTGPDGEPRLQVLQTVKEYASEGLRASGEEEGIRTRHATYFLALAEAAEPQLGGQDQESWLRRLDLERGNLRQALRWAREGDHPETGLRLAGALGRYWWVRGYIGEGRAWIDELLSAPSCRLAPSKDVRAKALYVAGQLAYAQGDDGRAAAPLEEALALRRELGDEEGAVLVLAELGVVVRRLGNDERAEVISEEALAVSRALSLRRSAAICLNTLGRISRRRGNLDLATVHHEESLTLFRGLKDVRGVAYTLANLGHTALDRSQPERALALQEKSLERYEEFGDKSGRAFALANLGDAVRALGDTERAGSLYGDALALHREIGNESGASRARERLEAVGRKQ